jgi:hypothetical protein
MALAGAVTALAAASWLKPVQQEPAEPCCTVAVIDAARGIVTIKDQSSRFTFRLTLSTPRDATGLRVGQAVGFSNAKNLLYPAEPAGRPVRPLALTQIQFAGFSGPTGAVGSAASSSGNGTFENPKDGKCGKVGTIIETSGKQCVVVQSSGAGCHFCVPIKK